MNRRNNDLFRSNAVHQQTDSRNICNGIHGTDFMEMNLGYRDSVRMALCLSDQTVDCHNILFHLLRKIQMITHNVLDVVEAAMVMMVRMLVVMIVCMLVIMCMVMLFVHVHMVMVVVMLLAAVLMMMCMTFVTVLMTFMVVLMPFVVMLMALVAVLMLFVAVLVVLMTMLVVLMTVLVVPMAVLMSLMIVFMLMMVVEHLLRLFFSMHQHTHMGSANAALAHRLLHKFHTRNSQTV